MLDPAEATHILPEAIVISTEVTFISRDARIVPAEATFISRRAMLGPAGATFIFQGDDFISRGDDFVFQGATHVTPGDDVPFAAGEVAIGVSVRVFSLASLVTACGKPETRGDVRTTASPSGAKTTPPPPPSPPPPQTPRHSVRLTFPRTTRCTSTAFLAFCTSRTAL